MKDSAFRLLIYGVLIATSTLFAIAQSQALNGQIEGTVSDQNNAAVANAAITATNTETGAIRTLTTDEKGIYRFPLLPLGSYRITSEAPNFKKFIREGVILTAGQTATIDIQMQTGDVREAVTILSDTPIADAGKTDLGRVVKNLEVQNLPIPQRNPYNLGLLQANVTGRLDRAFGPPQLNVNGYFRRVSYLFDGNRSSQAAAPGLRLLFISETYVNEVQIITNSFAAEFGDTPGMIFNVVTPSGTNKFRGSAGYRFSLTSCYARPFFYNSPNNLPKNNFSDLTATASGAIRRDRWHFYFGAESVNKDENTNRFNLVKISASDKAKLIAAGLSPSIFPASIPTNIRRDFYIFRTDAQIGKNSRLATRFNFSPHIGRNFISGGFNTLERSFDNISPDHSLGAQFVSFTSRILNEFRFQYAYRLQKNQRNEFSGTGVSITISDIANFGAPTSTGTISPLEKVTQIQDNLTWMRGAHVIKFGGGFSLIDDFKRSAIFSRYTFPSVDAYLNARNGSQLRGYSFYDETFGNPEIAYKAAFWNFFAQDDWKLTRRLKINFGLRYDLYLIPDANTNSPFAASRKFRTNKNNFAPRFGAVYALREEKRPTIIRFGAGAYYETPFLLFYESALLNNGNPQFFTFRLFTSNPGAPNFPNTLGSLPVGSSLPPQDIDTVAPDFKTMYALHFNFQIEQAITENVSFAAGFIHSAGRRLPVSRNINPVNPIKFLADGRPVFGLSRRDPRFNSIQMVESVGVSRYDALTLQLTRRFSRGLQLSANYTFSKATDDAPDNLIEGLLLSDPTNRHLDKGFSSSDQRHTFVTSSIFRPDFAFENKTLRNLFNNNQFAIITIANSGARFNITCGCDLNGDGFSTDRPVGIRRNSGTTPPQFNLDLRYSRFFNFREGFNLEVFGEFQNLFNIKSIVAYQNVNVRSITNLVTGELTAPLPDFRARNQSTAQESRQVQLGFKFIF